MSFCRVLQCCEGWVCAVIGEVSCLDSGEVMHMWYVPMESYQNRCVTIR